MSSSSCASSSLPPRRRVLIATADDLGYAVERDRGILRAFHHGLVRQASLLVTGPSAASGARDAIEAGLSLGLHFNLTEGVCLSDGTTMLGKAGFWAASRVPSEIKTEQVRAELVAQLERFEQLVGRKPHYVDGHNHIHVIPVVAEVFASVLPSYGVNFVRCPIEVLATVEQDQVEATEREPLPATQRAFFVELIAHAHTARSLWAERGLRTSDHFIGLQLMGARNSVAAMCRAIASLPEGVTELMCHPGFPSLEGDDFSQSAEREHELNTLCDPAVLEAVAKHGVMLAPWQDAWLAHDATE